MKSVTAPEITIANPSEPLSDAAISAIASLLLAAVAAEEADGRADEREGTT